MILTGSRPSPVPFHVMAKPRGAICNLDCSYCYFLDKENLYPGSDFRMSSEILERFTENYIASQPTNHVTFSWHGGEPTLAGIEFYEHALALQQKHRRPGMVIENTIQTNGILIDRNWSRFFADHEFLVGLSIDGPQEIHDAYRVDKGGKPTFHRVLAGLDSLREAGVTPNFLCTLTGASEGQGGRVYKFLRDDLGAEFIQFLPVVEKSPRGSAEPATGRSISPGGYGDFLIEVFDLWFERDVGNVFVQMFEVALAAWVGAPRGLCVFEETCGTALAIEHTGDVYSCDHFVEPKHRLGNIVFIPLAEMVGSDKQRKFGDNKRTSLPSYCLECDVRFACNGGCPKDRFIETPAGEPGLNYLCEGLRRFFRHIDGPMKRLAQSVTRPGPLPV